MKFAFVINGWIICGMSCSACVLLYDVTCFVLVVVRIYVPSSRTDCNSAVSDYIERVICM